MNDKDKKEKNTEYRRNYNAKHRPIYTHKRKNESRMSAYSRYNADVLIPIQDKINTEGFINGSKC